MIVKVVMSSEGLKNNAESGMIQASCGTAYASGIVYPVFSLTAGGEGATNVPSICCRSGL